MDSQSGGAGPLQDRRAGSHPSVVVQARVQDTIALTRIETLGGRGGGVMSSAPVYKLPHDVVREILEVAYLHHFPHCHQDHSLPHIDSPIAVSHVSRWWRQHALSVSSIWACIHVTPRQPDNYADMVKLYLDRSKSLPLSIFFLCRPYNSNYDPVELKRKLASVRPWRL